MTDDLEGRLGPEDLVEPEKKPPPVVLGVYLGEEDGPPSDEEEAVMKPTRAQASVAITYNIADAPDAPKRTETAVVSGTLDAFSFGKGWLVTVTNVDEKAALAMGRAFTAYEGVSYRTVHASVDGALIELSGDLDFTVGYGYSGCSFTVTADEGRYVGE